jgi:DNA-binding beta-propeller fold protein YncE
MGHYNHIMRRVLVLLLLVTGCTASPAPDLIWGEPTGLPGYMVRPRAVAIIGDRLYTVDFTARIQQYDLDGKFSELSYTPPDFRNGRPSGLGVDRDGNLIVCDSHYHCFRIYDHAGKEIHKIGGNKGSGPGQFAYISDCVQDADGYFYVSEFGVNDRITKLDARGVFVKAWGKAGTEPGDFLRLRALALGPDGNLYCADGCNHRVQVFTRDGELVRVIGGPGAEPGQFHYPFDLSFSPQGDLYVVERGNCRVQRLKPDGTPLGQWGTPGRGPGQLADPWAVAVDRFGRVHIVDTENHRVQRVKF